jgi:alpha/beta superfamily hydrolase
VIPRDVLAPLATRAAEPCADAPAPQPVLLEAAGHTCVAWWHAPADGVARPLAVVVASSWGDEELAAYDTQRALAIALARGGLGTLRFDWPDTGDSSAATGATNVADALAAFDAAARRALALSGHERLAFVGHRLGALLAAQAALAREDVDALVALDPVASGAAFVREQPVDAAVAARPGLGRVPGTVVDPAELPVPLGGFTLPARQAEALSALRWPAAATTSVLEALLVGSSRLGGRVAADALARLGVRVREAAPGNDMDGAIVEWLRERAADSSVMHGVAEIDDFGVADPGNRGVNARRAAARLEAATSAVLSLASTEGPAWMRLRERGVAVRERVVRIADAHGPALAAVLSERDPTGELDVAAVARHAIVLLSPDGRRRVGPHRLWVPWARHRAARGDVVLRLDVAGVGDSASSQADDHASGDVARAVAWLRRELGVIACTVVSVGSGARHAWRALDDDADVQRIVAIDPPFPRRGEARTGSRARHALRECARVATQWLQRPFEAELARAAERDVAVDLVLSGDPRSVTGRRARALLRDGRMIASHLPSTRPGFAAAADREALYARLDALMRSQGAGGAAAAVAMPAWRADARATPASEALRIIARASGATT